MGSGSDTGILVHAPYILRKKGLEGRALDAFVAGHFCHTKWWGGNFPTSPSICPTSPLVTANTPPVFCRFQLRSVTDEQHVRII